MKKLIGGVILLGTLTACTTIGAPGHNPSPPIDLGPEVAIRLGIYRDVAVSPARTQEIIHALQDEFAPLGLRVEVSWIRDWQRPAFGHKGLIRDIATRPLEAPCDRLLALVGRDARDFLWGVLLPEILGAVETRTHSKGYVVAELGSLNQLVGLQTPTHAAVHEFYHLLGVGHGWSEDKIYAQIARVKRLALENRRAGSGFVPAVTAKGRVYLTRAAVDRRFKIRTARAAAPPPAGVRVAASPEAGAPATGGAPAP
jgi:hypothetical protein